MIIEEQLRGEFKQQVEEADPTNDHRVQQVLGRARRQQRARRTWIAAAAAVAVAAVAFAGQWVTADHTRPEGPVAPDAADRPPIPVDDSWSVARFSGFEDGTTGQVTLTRGVDDVELTWRAASETGVIHERRAQLADPEPLVVLGQDASLFRFGPGGWSTVITPLGASFLEVRGNLDRAAYLRFLQDDLESVRLTNWAESLISPTLPTDRLTLLLEDVPLLPWFDARPLERLAERGRVGEVRGIAEAVVCSWVSRWVQTREAGDKKEAGSVSEVMYWSEEWPLLQAIQEDGDYPARVEFVAAGVLRNDVPDNWRTYLRCDRFPGNTNLNGVP